MKTSLNGATKVSDRSNDVSGASTTRRGVFLVEDHPITQVGLATLIGQEEDLFVCGTADSSPLALAQIERLKPAIVIFDFTLRESNGIEWVKNVVAVCPEAPILVMSMHDENL